MHTTFDQIDPIFNQFKSRENIEFEIRLGKITSNKFDTNVGNVTFEKILKGLEKYKSWENVIKTHTTVYFKGDIRVIDNEITDEKLCHKKTKIKKIDLSLTNQPFDIRFSVATEIPCSQPKDDTVYDDMRIRHRTSFIRKNLSIDMTKITGDPDDLDDEECESYEVELEIIDPKSVKDQNELYNMVYKVMDILKLLSN